MDPTRTSADPAAPEPSSDPAGPTASRDTLELLLEFCSDTTEGLDRADQILLNVERDGADGDTLAALSGIFEGIRTTAGLLGMDPLAALARATEQLLDACREGGLRLEGAGVDLTFDAVATVRAHLEAVLAALESGEPVPRGEAFLEVVERLRAFAGGSTVPERALPEVDAGQKLGEILMAPPLNVPAAVITRALQAQQRTGRRLGEELVASRLVEPSIVARALRAQSRLAGADARGPSRLRETVKVDLERLDGLVEAIGELVIVEGMMKNVPEFGRGVSERARACLTQLAKVTRDLQDAGMRMRMQPLQAVFQKATRAVRDLSRRTGKAVRLLADGEGTEMDRIMVEAIGEPLLHLVRNAIDHGIEPREDRERAGKPGRATLRLTAKHEGGNVVIEVSDDGRGLDRERIARKAIERGLIASAAGLTDAQVHALIFEPGFSTAEQVTEYSGRGVGMEVVKRTVEAMRGRVIVTSTPGAGTSFRLVLPLTLAIIDGLLVACGRERFVLPTLAVSESIRPEPGALVSRAGRLEILNLRGQILPLVRLDELLGLPPTLPDPHDGIVVVIEAAERRFGVLLDEVVSQQQVVIKGLGEGLAHVDLFSGAAILGDGQVGLILGVDALAGHALAAGGPVARA